MITDYTSLQNELKGNDGYLHRTDLDAKIPTFIQLCEAKLANQIRARKLEIAATLLTTASVNYVTLPTDYGSLKNLQILGTYNIPLVLMPDEKFNEYASSNGLGTPQFYTIQNDQLLLYPIPNSEMTISMVYYQELPKLSSTNTTNWVITKYPYVYLYGALVEAATFVNDPEQVQYNKTEFNNAIEDMWFNYALESFSGSSLRAISDYTEGM